MLAGPTAVGKTALSIKLAKAYGSVIISADSRQFYRELSIGTAKPGKEQLEQVEHHFIDTKSISELYGAGHFEKDAIQTLKKLFEKHRIVFMVGGSGLYIDAVLNGIDEFIDVPDAVRQEFNKKYHAEGLAWLQRTLQEWDPDYYRRVDLDNPQRLIRALEVIKHTGRPFSTFLSKTKVEREFTAIKLLINTNRADLYKRINSRVDEMMKAGLLEEAKQFAGFKSANALKTVGYKEMYEHLEGKYDLATAIDKIKQHTRNYAKRQITWFKNKDSFREFSANEPLLIQEYIDSQMSDD